MLNSASQKLNSSAQIAIAITNAPKGTGYLAFRDLPKILEEHVKGNEALDVGCGSGRSTKFLRDLGYQVIGIDKSKKMIIKAQEEDTNGDYRLTNDDEEWPLDDKKFDLIMFSFVLLECASKEHIEQLLQKAKTYLKETGVIVISTTSENAYKHDWLSMGTNFPENENPQSGDVVKIFLKDYGFEVKDYYWTDDDYESCFHNTGLSLLYKYRPLGNSEDKKAWVNEETIAPFSIYVTNRKLGL